MDWKKYITYWEPALENQSTPLHILICLAILRVKLGNDFLLLTKKNVGKYVCEDRLNKYWTFGTLEETEDKKRRMSIVAKSDFVRFEYIYNYGGVWVDSDALCVGNPYKLFSLLENSSMIWGYEAFFGAHPKYLPFAKACENMLLAPCQTWGNPGLIKDILSAEGGIYPYKSIPWDFIEPEKIYKYSWDNAAVVLGKEIDPKQFLNHNQVFLHLYNKAAGEVLSKIIESGDSNSRALVRRLVFSQLSEDVLLDAICGIKKELQ